MTDVQLIPLRSADFDVLADVRAREAHEMGFPDAFGPAEREELRERIERSGEFDGVELLLGIHVDGKLAGEVQARQPRMGKSTMQPACCLKSCSRQTMISRLPKQSRA